jgi:alpha-galactosidase
MFWGRELSLAMILIIAVGGSLIAKAAKVPGADPQSYVSDSQTTSKFITRDFVPDGNLQKPVWRHAPWMKVDRDAYGPATYPQSMTEIASLWTPSYAYFAFRCKYTNLNVFEGGDPAKDFWELWNRDVVEIFLNPAPEHMNHYFEFEVAPNNLWIDLEIDLDKKPAGNAQWNSGYEHATHIDPKNHVWTCEIRIPVAGLNGAKPIEANAEWRINFYRDDGPSNSPERRALSWSLIRGGTQSFHTPSSFGLIRFVK